MPAPVGRNERPSTWSAKRPRNDLRFFSPVNSRRGAEQYEHQIRQALLDGSYGKDVITPKVPTLAEFVDRFLTYSGNNNKPSTVVGKKRALTNHVVPFFGSIRLDEIGSEHIEEFRAAMRKKFSAARPRKPDASKYAV